jgi:hypothetical protein
MPGTPTTEQKIRGGADGNADWVLLVGGYDAEAVKGAITNELDGVVGLYRPAFSLSCGEIA